MVAEGERDELRKKGCIKTQTALATLLLSAKAPLARCGESVNMGGEHQKLVRHAASYSSFCLCIMRCVQWSTAPFGTAVVARAISPHF